MTTPRSLAAGLALTLGLLGTVAATAQEPAAEPAPPPEAEAPARPAAPEYQNTIRWATASESDNFGFDVYRGESEDGPFVRLTESPIPGAGNTDEPQRYEFVDDTIDPHKDYYYYVESISMSNHRERFTPVSKARAKLSREDAPAASEDPADG